MNEVHFRDDHPDGLFPEWLRNWCEPKGFLLTFYHKLKYKNIFIVEVAFDHVTGKEKCSSKGETLGTACQQLLNLLNYRFNRGDYGNV